MKKFYIRLVFLIIILQLFTCITYSQENPLDYFPHSVGDYWEYSTYHNQNTVIYPFSVVNNIDSIGNIYIYIGKDQDPRYIIDKNYNVYHYPMHNNYSEILYKLDAQKGEEWWYIKDEYQDGYGQKARVDSIFKGYWLGKATTFKEIGYYQLTDTADTRINVNSYSLFVRVIAKGFGYVYDYGGDKAPEWLSGCIIKGDTLGIIVSVKEIKGIPEKFSLKQNYPNPFNPSTNIEFEIVNPGKVKLEVYDLLGRKAAVLLDEYKFAGKYKVTFNTDDFRLTSGIYLYKLKMGKKSISKKMMLLK